MRPSPRFVVDDTGRKLSVVLDIEEYERLLEELEELECIKAYDAAKASGERPIPLAEALDAIDRARR